MAELITADLIEGEALARLQDLLDRITNRQPLMQAIGDLAQSKSFDHFDQQRGPDGTPWTPLRPATIRARLRRRASQLTILREKGDLRGSIRVIATENEVAIGSAVIYAAIHQFGGTIQKAASTRWRAGRRFAKRAERPDGAEAPIGAHAITIPARPYLGLSLADRDEAIAMARDWLAGESA